MSDLTSNRHRENDGATLQILALGHYHARRHSLQHADAWDCAMELLHDLLHDALKDTYHQESEVSLSGIVADLQARQQLWQRADRHAYNFARRKHSLAAHFVAKNEASEREWEQLPDTAQTPLELLMRREILIEIQAALEMFPTQDRALFLAYYEQWQDLQDLAVAYQTTTQILKQRLYRMRKRLKKRLEDRECNEAEMRFCLTPDHHV